MDIRQAILDTMERRELPRTKAHKELGISRQTLYAWTGPYSAVPPGPEHAEAIARFIDEPVTEVLEELLRMQAAKLLCWGDYNIKVTIEPAGTGTV